MFQFFNKILKKFNLGAKLYVAFDSGGNNKPTIVLIHGIAATSKTWDIFLKEIDTKAYRVVAIDLLGFGKSPKPKKCEYSVDDHVEYLDRTIRRLRIHTPFILIGHSMGAIIAARYNCQYRKKIKEIFLLGLPLYINDPQLHTNISKAYNDLYIKVYEFLLKSKSFAIKSSQNIRKLLRIEDGLSITEETWESFKLSLKNTIINQNTYNDIKRIKTPIHVVYGSLDEFLVQKNIERIAVFKNVDITKVYMADHVVGPRISKRVVQKLMN